ncbi:exo-alpha-sialidase, partial [Trypanosoma cruzi]
ASGEEKGHCALPLGHGQQPHVFCWTGCRGQCFKVEDRTEGLRYVILFALSLLLPPCVCCAHGNILWCDVDGVAIACALVRVLCVGFLLPMTPPLCAGEWRCEELSVSDRCFRTFAFFTHVAPLGSLLQHQAVD